MQQSPREHHEPRRGSAFRAAPRLVHCRIAAISADPCTRAALPSSLRAERIATPCHSSPEQHDESGMANDEQMGRGVAGECWRAHQVRHCHRRGQRSRFGRRRRPQLDAVRQPCAVLLTRPTYGTCLARPLSTLDVGPGKSEARLCSRSDFPGPAAGLERNRAQHVVVPQDGADAFRGKTSAPGHLRLDLLAGMPRLD